MQDILLFLSLYLYVWIASPQAARNDGKVVSLRAQRGNPYFKKQKQYH
jgi:hypothetical protein